jgi:hypothetical protein
VSSKVRDMDHIEVRGLREIPLGEFKKNLLKTPIYTKYVVHPHPGFW